MEPESAWHALTGEHGPAPKEKEMSRREEVKNKLISCRNVIDRGTLARTLADEVDAERAIVTKLLEMLEPGVAPPKSHQSCSCVDCRQHEINEGRYNRALEIAGRKE